MGLILAMYGNEVKLGQAFFISIFAMIVVFLVLLIISYLIDITAFFIHGKKKKVEVKKEAVNESTAKPSEIKKETKGKSDGLVVTIAAAIAAYLGTSVDNVRIKSIRRVPQSDTPWTERGLLAQINKL